MEVVEGQWPPCIDAIEKKFKVKEKNNILYAYDNRIFNPSKVVIPEHLIVHESVHLHRQYLNGMTPVKWWEKYIKDTGFRLLEEISAHKAEWGSFVKNFSDRNVRARHLHFMSLRLSGDLYGGMCSMKQARQYITGNG